VGAASGAVAPRRHYTGLRLRRYLGALILGFLAGIVCLWGVNGLKKMLGADDALDVFGVHGVGGILGALMTGVFAAPKLGGQGVYDYVANKVSADYSIADQLMIQGTGVLTTIVWSGVVAFVAYKIVDLTIGLRVTEEESAKASTSARTANPRIASSRFLSVVVFRGARRRQHTGRREQFGYNRSLASGARPLIPI
jgi:Amt family ammonium transporter